METSESVPRVVAIKEILSSFSRREAQIYNAAVKLVQRRGEPITIAHTGNTFIHAAIKEDGLEIDLFLIRDDRSQSINIAIKFAGQDVFKAYYALLLVSEGADLDARVIASVSGDWERVLLKKRPRLQKNFLQDAS